MTPLRARLMGMPKAASPRSVVEDLMRLNKRLEDAWHARQTGMLTGSNHDVEMGLIHRLSPTLKARFGTKPPQLNHALDYVGDMLRKGEVGVTKKAEFRPRLCWSCGKGTDPGDTPESHHGRCDCQEKSASLGDTLLKAFPSGRRMLASRGRAGDLTGLALGREEAGLVNSLGVLGGKQPATGRRVGLKEVMERLGGAARYRATDDVAIQGGDPIRWNGGDSRIPAAHTRLPNTARQLSMEIAGPVEGWGKHELSGGLLDEALPGDMLGKLHKTLTSYLYGESPILDVATRNQVMNRLAKRLGASMKPGGEGYAETMRRVSDEMDGFTSARKNLLQRDIPVTAVGAGGAAEGARRMWPDDEPEKSAALLTIDGVIRRARNATHTHPTPAQAAAGNYRKGSLALHGIAIKIENPNGTERRGYDADGNVTWRKTMQADYGYFANSKAIDGDAVDCFIGPDLESEFVVAVDQRKADGAFDETKFVLGCSNQLQAERLYLAHYPRGWKLGPVSTTTVQQLKKWLKDGDTQAPFKGQMVKAAGGKFCRPENDDVVEETTHYKLSAGGNDWENTNTWMWVDLRDYRDDATRLWAQVAFPADASPSDDYDPKTHSKEWHDAAAAKAKAHGDGAPKVWVTTAKKCIADRRKETGYGSGNFSKTDWERGLEAALTHPDMKPYVAEHGKMVSEFREKSASGNKAFRRLMQVLARDPSALSRSSAAGYKLDTGKLGLGLTSPAPNMADLAGRAQRLTEKFPEKVKSVTAGSRGVSNDPSDSLWRKLHDLSRKTQQGFGSVRDTGYPSQLERLATNSRAGWWHSLTAPGGSVRHATENLEKGLRKKTGIQPLQFTPRGDLRIPVDSLPIAPDKFTWKGAPDLGQESSWGGDAFRKRSVNPGWLGDLTDTKVPFFSSGLPVEAARYGGKGRMVAAGGGASSEGLLFRIPSHKLEKPLPKVVGGVQSVEDGKALYTPHLGLVDDAERMKWMNTHGAVPNFEGADPFYETVNRLKKRVPARWRLTEDGKFITPGRVRVDPRNESFLEPLRRNLLTQIDPKNLHGLTPDLGKSVADIPKRMARLNKSANFSVRLISMGSDDARGANRGGDAWTNPVDLATAEFDAGLRRIVEGRTKSARSISDRMTRLRERRGECETCEKPNRDGAFCDCGVTKDCPRYVSFGGLEPDKG